ncbi:cwf18 pre-mRNA splicing factor-domain-containing protein, partial [Pilobolus umbonatus]
ERTLRFRNYTPQDEKLKEHAQISTPDDIKDNIESETKNFTKEALAQAAEKEKEEVDLFNLAPKKPNWDLKRDVEKKLDKLERQTQRAIYQIIRTRLEADENANLADIVANGVAEQNIQDVEE